MAVSPDDVAADHASLLLVAAVAGAVQGEVAQRGELRFDPVEPGASGRGAGDLGVVRLGPRPARRSRLVVRCGEKLPQMIAMRISRGQRLRTYRANSRNLVRVLRGLMCP